MGRVIVSSPLLRSFSPPTHTQPNSVQTCWVYCFTWQPDHHLSSSSRSNTCGSGSSLESWFKPKLPPIRCCAGKHSRAPDLAPEIPSSSKKEKKWYSKWIFPKGTITHDYSLGYSQSIYYRNIETYWLLTKISAFCLVTSQIFRKVISTTGKTTL